MSRQLDAIFVARKMQLQNRTCKPGAIFSAICRRDIAGVSNMFETRCNFSVTKIASSCRDKNHLCKRASWMTIPYVVRDGPISFERGEEALGNFQNKFLHSKNAEKIEQVLLYYLGPVFDFEQNSCISYCPSKANHAKLKGEKNCSTPLFLPHPF